ncbi:energy transducer TonB [Chryseobacterium sp. Marseille-Q8038]
MKKISILILLLGAQFAFAQTTQKEEPISQPTTSAENNNIEIPAEYPGGMAALRKYILNEFNTSKIKNSGVFTSTIEFVVSTEGNIESVSSSGNDKYMNEEMERVIKSIKTKWKPAQNKGKTVRYFVKFPTTVNIQ